MDTEHWPYCMSGLPQGWSYTTFTVYTRICHALILNAIMCVSICTWSVINQVYGKVTKQGGQYYCLQIRACIVRLLNKVWLLVTYCVASTDKWTLLNREFAQCDLHTYALCTLHVHAYSEGINKCFFCCYKDVPLLFSIIHKSQHSVMCIWKWLEIINKHL